MRPVSWIWWGALLIFLLFLLVRDGFRGRSMGKRVMAVDIQTRTGQRVGILRSILRNLPLVIPIWNLVEVAMIFFARQGRRTGDRMAGTIVADE